MSAEKARRIKRIGLFVNPEKPAERALLREAAAIASAAGCETAADSATRREYDLPLPEFPSLQDLARWANLLTVFGGDGSMLRVARETAGTDCLILGVNLGTLGFLTACSAQETRPALEQTLAGQFEVDRRRLIEASLPERPDHPRWLALNDFVIGRGATPRLIELEVTVDGDTLTRYRGDGLIVSSPTGSTAYSLAAGGAVVSPNAEVFALTPICPHTLSNRSVIVSLDAQIVVRLLTRRVETYFSPDGRMGVPLQVEEPVVIRKSSHQASLVRLPGRSFFKTLREKMHWRGSTLSGPKAQEGSLG